MDKIATPKGTHDLLPTDMTLWHFVEQTAREVFGAANFGEIRTPMFEETSLFERGVGEGTDIVNKEMYTFSKSDRSLTLRPENTAGVVRAYIQHGMDRLPKPVKLYYMGPMFRYERPQAGRQRQFHQIGVECFGLDTPEADAEVIALAMTFFKRLGLPNLTLDINNIGGFDDRENFRSGLRALFQPKLSELCPDCQTRFETNPLRMLDCKVPTCKALYAEPQIQAFLAKDHTGPDSQAHYRKLRELLDALKIPYTHNHMLVRGLDYYTRTVFEITSNHLGAQNAVCGGGRYNRLVKDLGGPDTPAVGWALGVERLVSLVNTLGSSPDASSLDYFIVSDHTGEALKLASRLREQGKRVDLDLSGKAMGKQFAQANKLGAIEMLILGETERAAGQVTVKTLATGEQRTVDLSSL